MGTGSRGRASLATSLAVALVLLGFASGFFCAFIVIRASNEEKIQNQQILQLHNQLATTKVDGGTAGVEDASATAGGGGETVEVDMSSSLYVACNGTAVEECALGWLAANVKRFFDDTKAAVVVHYTWDGHVFALPKLLHPNTTVLTPLLENQNREPPMRAHLPEAQIVMAPPTHFRFNSLLTTNNLFDYQLLLRTSDFASAVSPSALPEVLAGLISMGRETFLILPFLGNPKNVNQTADQQNDDKMDNPNIRQIMEAVAEWREKDYELGAQKVFEVDVQPIALFGNTGTSSAFELLHVRVVKVHRGAMLKWCYYPKWVRFVLQYTRGEKMAMRPIDPSPRNQVLRVFNTWHSNINLADLVGWGTTTTQRELLWLETLRHGNCPDPAVQNWLVTNGGHLLRIDGNDNSKFTYPEGASYLQFLRMQMCLPNVAGTQEWKQLYESDVAVAKPALFYLSDDKLTKFKLGHFAHRTSTTAGFEAIDGAANSTTFGLYTNCPTCGACLRHTWRKVKMVWHTATSLPPPACKECYSCARKAILKDGMPIKEAQFQSCSDVEGIHATEANGGDTDTRRCFPGKQPADRWVITQPSWPHKKYFPKLLPGDENPYDKIHPGNLNAVK